MEFQDVVRRRRMVRRFRPEAVAEASVQRILANAVRGPSAGFAQGQVFLVLVAESCPASGGSARTRWTSRCRQRRW